MWLSFGKRFSFWKLFSLLLCTYVETKDTFMPLMHLFPPSRVSQSRSAVQRATALLDHWHRRLLTPPSSRV
jgi:hypothetical protein